MLISTQHQPGIDAETLIKPDLIEHVITPLLPSDIDTSDVRVLVNPTGNFELGGPYADCGLTGRKIIVDTYGGAARHGGGAFSGKDPSKVDRSAAYAARWVAKNVVAAGAASRCEVQVAYAIGVAQPVSVLVETFGTENVDPDKISDAVREVFDLRPAAIIRDLELRRPIYQKTAAYGHFGREDKDLTWEHTTRVGDLKNALGSRSRPASDAAGRPGAPGRAGHRQDLRLPGPGRAPGPGARRGRGAHRAPRPPGRRVDRRGGRRAARRRRAAAARQASGLGPDRLS